MTRCALLILVSLVCGVFVATTVVAEHSDYAAAILTDQTTPVMDKFRQLIKQHKHKQLQAFIDQGADPDSQDNKGVRPIHHAAFFGDIVALRILIQSGAELNSSPFGGWTPLHYAAFSGHLDIINLLIAMGADVNAKDAGGETPLFYAMETSENTLLMVSLLVERGADINALNNKSENPLFIARRRGVEEVVEYLLNKGADDSASDPSNGKQEHDSR